MIDAHILKVSIPNISKCMKVTCYASCYCNSKNCLVWHVPKVVCVDFLGWSFCMPPSPRKFEPFQLLLHTLFHTLFFFHYFYTLRPRMDELFCAFYLHFHFEMRPNAIGWWFILSSILFLF